jgi:hypothetical protein
MHLALLEEKAKEKNRGVRASAMTVKWTTPSQPSNLAARRPKGPYPQKAATPMVRCGAPGSSTGGRRPPPLLLCAPGSSSLPQPSRATHCHAPRSPSSPPQKASSSLSHTPGTDEPPLPLPEFLNSSRSNPCPLDRPPRHSSSYRRDRFRRRDSGGNRADGTCGVSLGF